MRAAAPPPAPARDVSACRAAAAAAGTCRSPAEGTAARQTARRRHRRRCQRPAGGRPSVRPASRRPAATGPTSSTFRRIRPMHSRAKYDGVKYTEWVIDCLILMKNSKCDDVCTSPQRLRLFEKLHYIQFTKMSRMRCGIAISAIVCTIHQVLKRKLRMSIESVLTQ